MLDDYTKELFPFVPKLTRLFFQWLSNTNQMTQLVQNITEVNWRMAVDWSNVVLQIKGEKCQKVTVLLTHSPIKTLCEINTYAINSQLWFSFCGRCSNFLKEIHNKKLPYLNICICLFFMTLFNTRFVTSSE